MTQTQYARDWRPQPTRIVADPRTFQLDPKRGGLRGHPGFGRDADFLLRLPPGMKRDLIDRARQERRTITDIILEFVAVGLNGPRADAPVEAVAPELTPDVASKNLDKTIAQVADQFAPVATTQQETTMPDQADGPNPWTDLLPALTERVSEQNVDIWLSGVRFLGAEDSRLQLQVQNSYFEEYLSEHYKEVIKEELHKAHGKPVEVEFVVAPPKAEAPPTTSEKTNPLLDMIIARGIKTLDDLEAFEDSLYPELYRRRLDAAAERCTRYQGDAFAGRRAVGFNDARMAEEVAVLKSQRLKEEKAREEFRKNRRLILSKTVTGQLKQPGNPRSHRQYAAPSHFDTDGRPDRGLVIDAARALKN